MYGPRIRLRRLPLITEAITTVIRMTVIIMPEGITDMVGTLEEVGIGTIIPMVATRIEGIIVGLTGPAGVGVDARPDSFPVLPGTRFPGKGPVFPSLIPVRRDGGSLHPSEGLEHSVGSGLFFDSFRINGR